VDNIKMDIRDIEWDGMGAVESSCEHDNERRGSKKFWEFVEFLSNYWYL
jgi:hypothetical protein